MGYLIMTYSLVGRAVAGLNPGMSLTFFKPFNMNEFNKLDPELQEHIKELDTEFDKFLAIFLAVIIIIIALCYHFFD